MFDKFFLYWVVCKKIFVFWFRIEKEIFLIYLKIKLNWENEEKNLDKKYKKLFMMIIMFK